MPKHGVRPFVRQNHKEAEREAPIATTLTMSWAGGAGASTVDPVAAAAGLNEELVSKAKQSRGEKKARKIMSKLGIRQVYNIISRGLICIYYINFYANCN